MELTDEEVRVLNEWFLKAGWMDRDWKEGDDIQSIRIKIRNEVTRINYNKTFNNVGKYDTNSKTRKD